MEINVRRKIFVAYNLTMEDEELIWGYPDEIEKKIKSKNITKGEFILIIDQL